jgi:quercetin dioxygenase-like cupin family protein
MKAASFSDTQEFNPDRVTTKVILESSFTKEIRILLKQGQLMKEHKTPFPIVIHVIEGDIDFGVEGKIRALKTGDIIGLEGNIPHDLSAKADSVVRLTLSKLDKAERVEKAILG